MKTVARNRVHKMRPQRCWAHRRRQRRLTERGSKRMLSPFTRGAEAPAGLPPQISAGGGASVAPDATKSAWRRISHLWQTKEKATSKRQAVLCERRLPPPRNDLAQVALVGLQLSLKPAWVEKLSGGYPEPVNSCSLAVSDAGAPQQRRSHKRAPAPTKSSGGRGCRRRTSARHKDPHRPAWRSRSMR